MRATSIVLTGQESALLSSALMPASHNRDDK
jgi:hypothetical protein